jgi:hypothetical protein
MVETSIHPWSPFTRERLLRAPIVSGVDLVTESPTRAEDEELVRLTGGRGFPVLGSTSFGYPAARACAPSTVKSQILGGRRLFAYDRWHGPLYLDDFGGLGVGMWRDYLAVMARLHDFAAFWPPLLVYPRKDDRTFWPRLAERFGLSPPPEATFLYSDDIVAATPRIFVRTLDVLRDILSFCTREGARAALETGAGVPTQIAREPSALPPAPPAHADIGPFASRRIWVENRDVIQTDSILEQVVRRLDATPTEAVRRRPPAPAFGSDRLKRFLDRQGAMLIASPQVPAPPALTDSLHALWGGGCLAMRREHEMLDGCLWLGLLPRENSPERTATILEFEDDQEVLPTGPRSALRLVRWPVWSWKGMELVTVGGWHDWKLFLWAGEHGLWSYAALPEQMDCVAGDIRTWLDS